MKLENNIAFVTGGGRSIGRAICLKLAEEGADVVIANSSLEPANEVADLVRAKGRRCSVIRTDVTDYQQVKLAVLQGVGLLLILNLNPDHFMIDFNRRKIWQTE